MDIIPASAPGSEVKLRDAAHELNEEKRKSARRKEYVSQDATLLHSSHLCSAHITPPPPFLNKFMRMHLDAQISL